MSIKSLKIGQKEKIQVKLVLTLIDAYNHHARHLMNEMVGENINQEYFDNISDLLLKCYEHLDIDGNSPYYSSNRNSLMWWLISSVNAFTRRSLGKTVDLFFKEDFCKMVLLLNKNYFSQAYNESYYYQQKKYSGSKLNEQLIKVTTTKNFLKILSFY